MNNCNSIFAVGMGVCIGSTDPAMGGPASVSYANVSLEHGDVPIFDCVFHLPNTLADIHWSSVRDI
jgi:hypothetical protein